MQFKIDKQTFSKTISSVESIISAREIRSVVSSILIETNEDSITLTATDLELSIKTTVAAEIVKPGSLVVPAKKLSQAIREFRSDSLQIDADEDSRLNIKDSTNVSKANIHLMGTPSDEYPPIPTLPTSEFTEIPMGLLQDMIRKTIHSIATDDQRYVFNGLFMVKNEDMIDFVATDGRRLSLMQRDLSSNGLFEDGVIVPNKAIKELQRILEPGKKCGIAINRKDKQIYFKVGTIDFISKLLDGKYPDYNMVIPKTLEHEVVLNKEEFESCIRQIAVMSSEPTKQIRLRFANGSLVISASTPDVGEAEDSLDVDYSGEEITTAFNSNFLLDITRVLDSETIIIQFTDSLTPAVIKDPNDAQYTSVIMPMKV